MRPNRGKSRSVASATTSATAGRARRSAMNTAIAVGTLAVRMTTKQDAQAQFHHRARGGNRSG